MANISIWGALVIGLIPLGQLWARIFWMNGSLDKSWLLLPFFWFPPLGLISAFMFWMGWVKDGPGGRPPYDTWMVVPIICKFMIGMFLSIFAGVGSKMSDIGDDYGDDYGDDDEQNGGGLFTAIIPLIIQLCVNAVPHYIRSYELCKQHRMNNAGKAFVDGTIENGVGLMAPTILRFIPFIGIFFRVLSMIPILGGMMNKVIWTLMYVGCYVIINMINESDVQKMCNIDLFGTSSDKIAFVIFLIISFIYSM